MIDEAHERSHNIDVILGLAHQLLSRRQDFRVIVSSATLCPEQFQRFFQPVAGIVPLISIRTRSYPIDIRYQPIAAHRGAARDEAIAQRILDIHRHMGPGHILVFLSGEGDIRHLEAELQKVAQRLNFVVLPLFARLTRDQQERVFADFGPLRKVILATNIAETSITIPEVRYVIDSGLAKVPSFSTASGITTLREVPISRASAEQRAGRAGRTGPGVVWRLYSERSFAERAERTSEEILRTDLSELALRLIDLGVRDIESFPFPTPPPRAKVRAAVALLRALGAVDEHNVLTPTGRRMVPFPLAPSLARMVIEAADSFPRVVDDVLVAGAFLSSRSPFVEDEPTLEQARRAHRRFFHPLGDVVTFVQVYRAWCQSHERQRFCKQNFLDPQTLEFVAKAHGQLTEIASEQGIEVARGGSGEELVRAVAAGLADRILKRRGLSNEYDTLSGARVALHPSSALMGKAPTFAVAAELIEHARAYAFHVSAVRREWLPQINPRATARFGGKTRAAKTSQPTAEPPTHLRLGSLELKISQDRGRPTVELSLDQLPILASLGVADLAPEAAKVRAQVRWTSKNIFAALPLAKLLGVVRIAQFPQPEELPPKKLELGVLYELDRGRHGLENAMRWILKPAVTGKCAGWLALVANGAGGYWLDLVPYFHDAVQATRLSAEALVDEIYDGDPLLEHAKSVVAVMKEFEEKLGRGQ
jgi:ATP-dependent helicase HrpA